MNIPSVGYMYILSNPSLPGQIKLGKSVRSPANNTAELCSGIGFPTPFILEHWVETHDRKTAYEVIHEYWNEKGHAVPGREEFFRLSVDDAIETMNHFSPAKGRGDAHTLLVLAQECEFDSETMSANEPRSAYFYKLSLDAGYWEAGYKGGNLLQTSATSLALQMALASADGGFIAAHSLAARLLRKAGQPDAADQQLHHFFRFILKLKDLSSAEAHEVLMCLNPFRANIADFPAYAVESVTKHRVVVLNKLFSYCNQGGGELREWVNIWLLITPPEIIRGLKEPFRRREVVAQAKSRGLWGVSGVALVSAVVLLANMTAASPRGGIGLILGAIGVGLICAVSAISMHKNVSVFRLAGEEAARPVPQML